MTTRIGRLRLGTAAIVRAQRRRLVLAIGRLGGDHYIALEYPTAAAERPRYGHGRPPHPELAAIISRDDELYRSRLEAILDYEQDLLALDREQRSADEPFWLTGWLPGLDTASLYAFLRSRAPRHYVEIGSGSSTAVAARAKRDGRLSTRITSIDPSPRVGIDRLCDDAIREPLEAADLSLFAELSETDVVFFDGTHRVFANSDATTFFLDVVPALAPGVLVGVHDVFLPDDYPNDWTSRYYSEQYLLAAYLLAGERVRTFLPCHYVGQHPELRDVLAPLWESQTLQGVDPLGLTFWLTKA